MKTDETVLTDRQKEVLHLVRDKSMTTAAAGGKLGISYNATNEHVRALRKKGFLTKKAKSTKGRSTSAKPVTVVTGSTGRLGKVMSLLQDAEFEIVAAMTEAEAEMATLTTLKQELHMKVKALS